MLFLTTRHVLWIVVFCSLVLPAIAQKTRNTKAVTKAGLVIPRNGTGMYVRNPDGQFEIEITPKTRYALQVNTRLFRGLQKNVLRYRIQASKQTIDFPVPEGPISAIISLRGARRVGAALAIAEQEHWIPEFGLALHFGVRLQDQLPTADDPRFVGIWDPTSKPRTLTIKERKYELSLKKGGQTNALLYNVIEFKDCKPYVNRARVTGHLNDTVLLADQIHVLPIGDQTTSDDPRLPRYLFIGDSISGNYTRGLRSALEGKFNIHHPPTNCGPSGKGKASIVDWVGAHEQKGRHWDVISFNFGHWDAGNDKATYQANLESVISHLEQTGARLIWVTTCPVPNAFPPAGELSAVGKAPRRTAGVMKKYLNPWAMQVIKRHPKITVCDQWQFVKDHRGDLYQKWWTGQNVHFGGKPADALGQLLADHVLNVTQVE